MLKDDMYNKYLHGIDEVHSDNVTEHVANLNSTREVFRVGDELKRETRISLTIRNVPKTSKLKLNFFR